MLTAQALCFAAWAQPGQGLQAEAVKDEKDSSHNVGQGKGGNGEANDGNSGQGENNGEGSGGKNYNGHQSSEANGNDSGEPTGDEMHVSSAYVWDLNQEDDIGEGRQPAKRARVEKTCEKCGEELKNDYDICEGCAECEICGKKMGNMASTLEYSEELNQNGCRDCLSFCERCMEASY